MLFVLKEKTNNNHYAPHIWKVKKLLREFTRSDQKYLGQNFLSKNNQLYRSDNHVGYLATSPDATYERSGWQIN
jgi:hypothetical protein